MGSVGMEPRWDLAWLRDQLPVLRNVTYLNVAHQGVTAEPVAAWTLGAIGHLEREGLAIDELAHGWLEQARVRTAGFLDGEPSEIAFTRNATEALNAVLNGLNLRGDVLVSDQEHPALLYGLLARQRSRDVNLRTFEVGATAAETLDHVAAALNRTTRLVAFSHVSCLTGVRLPAREICALAARHGALTLVDGAQAAGQFRISVRDLGCDFYAANAHKWLCGPKGTGMLYARRERITAVRPLYLTYGSVISVRDGELELATTGARFEYGERGVAHAGIAPAIEWLEGLGWSNIESHMKALSAELKQRVMERRALKLHTPVPWDETSGIVTFSVGDMPATEARDRLRRQFNILVRRVLEYNALRVSTAYFNTIDDITRLMSALDVLTEDR